MSEITFRTETGSIYAIDNQRLTWRRLRHTDRSGVLRSEGGSLTAPVEICIGEPAVLVGPPFEPGLGSRLVITTRVEAIVPTHDTSERIGCRSAGGQRR